MPIARVTVFGGTGFLGRRIAEHLLARDFTVRVAVRHPERSQDIFGSATGLEPVHADVLDAASVANALENSQAVVNAVGLYVEHGNATFRAVHVDGAKRVAEAARRHGAERLVHVSGIGADPDSSSPYVRCRADGEHAVRDTFDRATVFRPSVMFGPDDAFLNTLASLVRMLPVLPLFGRGRILLQPVFVGDVAQAAANALDRMDSVGRVYELGGPAVYSYRDLVEMVMHRSGRRRLLVPVPYFVWDGLAAAATVLPTPPLTEGHVALMKRDNIAAPGMPGLQDLDVSPTAINRALDRIL